MSDKFSITIKKAILVGILETCKGATAKTTTMPVLKHVLLQIVDGRLQASATDLEIAIVRSCPVDDLFSPGSIVLPCEKFLNIVKALPGADVEIEEKASRQVKVTGGDADFTIAGLDPADFPAIDACGGDHVLTVDADHLQDFVRACRHAVSTDILKYNLSGIRLEFDALRDILSAVATNGKCLSVARRTVDREAIHKPEAFAVTVPDKGCGEILRLPLGSVQVYLDKNHIHFVYAGGSLSCRLIDGDFPDYRRVIPEDHPGVITVDAERLLQALKRVDLIALDSTQRLHITKQALYLSAIAGGDEANDRVAAEIVGEPLEIGIKAKQFMTALPLLGAEVIVKYNDNRAPLLLIPVDHGPWDERLELSMPVIL